MFEHEIKKPKKPLKKIEPYTPYWERLANEEARDYAPVAIPCEDCGRPRLTGFACNFCRGTKQ